MPLISLTQKDLLGIEDLTPEEIKLILDTAEMLKEISRREIKKVPTLRGKTIVTFFFESSTRTRTSFDIAAKRLSADTFSLTGSSSSLTKGETLLDTARNLEAMNPDLIIIRHPASGAPHFVAERIKPGVINAGDGMHEHPTQALLDMLTVRDRFGRLDGLKLAIVGDLFHSRVARSNIMGFTKMGARVTVAGPPSLIPPFIQYLGAEVAPTMEEAISGADVIMMLRVQNERLQGAFFPSVREYAVFYGLDRKKLALAKENALVMHPGPINRGVEISPDVADGPQSVILDQVTNGVAVRMAVLLLLIGGRAGEKAN
ncbi:MAG: aspartate carbamoyltransferase catalytic subunit [Deltaproteobacteria bacterium]|nr:aspartate carbamoyltransferase catalytic subunit [Deltaproteobacteria bacterium]